MNTEQKAILEAMTNPDCTCDAITRASLPHVQLALKVDNGIRIGKVALKKHLDALIGKGLVTRTACPRRGTPEYTVNVPAALEVLAPPAPEENTTASAKPFDPLAALMGLA